MPEPPSALRPSRYSGGSMSRPLGSRLRERLLVNSFFTISHFLLLVTTFSHLCPKPYPVSSNVAKLALSANYQAISPPVSACFCGGKKWQVTTATLRECTQKNKTRHCRQKQKANRGTTWARFQRFRAECLDNMRENQDYLDQAGTVNFVLSRPCATGFSQKEQI